jgi:hypothetical protein
MDCVHRHQDNKRAFIKVSSQKAELKPGTADWLAHDCLMDHVDVDQLIRFLQFSMPSSEVTNTTNKLLLCSGRQRGIVLVASDY